MVTRKRKRTECVEFTRQVRLALRKVQRRTSCATKVLQCTLELLQPFFKEHVPVTCLRRTNRRLFTRSGAQSLKLNGCVHCHQHVFPPWDKSVLCPGCGGGRYDAFNQPNEVSI